VSNWRELQGCQNHWERHSRDPLPPWRPLPNPPPNTIEFHTTAGKLAGLRKRTEETLHPVGEAEVETTHAKGKLTARARICALLDEGSYVELGALARHRRTAFGLADKTSQMFITGPGVSE